MWASQILLVISVQIVCPYSMHFNPNRLTYDEASSFCSSQCGSTLSLHPATSNEDDLALNLIKSAFLMDTDTDIWTGFHYDSTATNWQWPDGSTYAGWSATNTVGYCGKLVVDATSLTMTEAPCSEYHAFFCDSCDTGAVANKYLLHRAEIGVSERVWSSAETYCNSQYDTHLISVHNVDDYWAGQRLAAFDTGTSSWFALKGPKSSGFSYASTDGTQFDYGTTDYAFPWTSSQPDGNGNDACAVYWSSYSYKWDDEACDQSKNFLCSIPSQLCNTHGYWQYFVGDGGSWTQLPSDTNQCTLSGTSNTSTAEPTLAILNNLQYVHDGAVNVEFSFSIQSTPISSNNGIGILFDVTSIDDYLYAGVTFSTSGGGATLVTYRSIAGVATGSQSLSISLAPSLDTIYTLFATLSTTELSLKFNQASSSDTLTVSNTHTFDQLTFDGLTASFSGYIGVSFLNTEMTAHTLYVSGTAADIRIFPGLNIASFTPVPTTNPTNVPSVHPSDSPTLNPTSKTTTFSINYGVHVVITFVAPAGSTNLPALLQNITSKIIQDKLESEDLVDCLLSNDYDITINNTATRTTISATIFVCSETAEVRLSLSLDNAELETDFIDNTVMIEQGSFDVRVEEVSAEAAETTVMLSTGVPDTESALLFGLDQKTFLLYIFAAIIVCLVCLVLVLVIGTWRALKRKRAISADEQEKAVQMTQSVSSMEQTAAEQMGVGESDHAVLSSPDIADTGDTETSTANLDNTQNIGSGRTFGDGNRGIAGLSSASVRSMEVVNSMSVHHATPGAHMLNMQEARYPEQGEVQQDSESESESDNTSAEEMYGDAHAPGKGQGTAGNLN